MVDSTRVRRRKLIKNFIFVFCTFVIVTLAYLAKGLLLPCITAAVLAYLCKPLVYILRRKGWSSHLAVATVALVLIGTIVLAARAAMSALPTGTQRIAMQVRIENRINQKIQKVLKINTGIPNQEPTWVYKKFSKEIDLMMARLNSIIRISEDDKNALEQEYSNVESKEKTEILEMLEANQQRLLWPPSEKYSTESSSEAAVQQHLSHVLSSFSIWILFPIIFFFLLGDDGSIFRYFMGFVPNHFFELALTMLERVDKALGHYLRGTALECFLVGAVIGFGFWLFGVSFSASVLIGLVAGITNAIPFLGTVVGLAMGLGYGLTTDHIEPVLPFVTGDDLLIGVVVSVTVAHLLDNAVFQPVLVGKAVNLHPIVVILSVAAGGMAFGLAGVLGAIPTVVIINTCLGTLVSGLKDYRLI